MLVCKVWPLIRNPFILKHRGAVSYARLQGRPFPSMLLRVQRYKKIRNSKKNYGFFSCGRDILGNTTPANGATMQLRMALRTHQMKVAPTRNQLRTLAHRHDVVDL